MSQTAEFTLNGVVGDLIREAQAAGLLPSLPEGLSINDESSIETRRRPCVVVTSSAGDFIHPRLVGRDLSVVVLTQRDDTAAEVADSWIPEIATYLEDNVAALCERLHARGWLVRTWVPTGDTAEEDEKRGWRSELTFKVILMPVPAEAPAVLASVST